VIWLRGDEDIIVAFAGVVVEDVVATTAVEGGGVKKATSRVTVSSPRPPVTLRTGAGFVGGADKEGVIAVAEDDGSAAKRRRDVGFRCRCRRRDSR